MARKTELSQSASGVYYRNVGWKRTPGGYAQHKFYLGRDEHHARVANGRLEQLWEQVCERWGRRPDVLFPKTGRTVLVEFGAPPAIGTSPPGPTQPFREVALGDSPGPTPGKTYGLMIYGDGGPPPGPRVRPVWDAVTLALAGAVRDGAAEARMPVPGPADGGPGPADTVGGWLDRLRQDFSGIAVRLAAPDAHARAEDEVTEAARHLIDHGRRQLVRQAGGETLHAALGAYTRWIDAKYRTLDGRRTAWGGTQLRQVEFIRRRLPDGPLRGLDAPAVEGLFDVIRSRPAGEDGKPVSVSWTRNCLKQFRHFLRWVARAPEFDWTPPANLDVAHVRVPETSQERSAALRSAQVETYTPEELSLLWLYATPFQRLLLLLGLNCGFGRAESASLEVEEVHLRRRHPNEAELGTPTRPTDSWVLRIRHKSGVYGEWKLWPESVLAIDWWLGQRAALPVAAGVTTLLVTRKGQRYDTPTKGNHPNFMIPNAWIALARRVRKDHPGFRVLSFNKLRKTAGNLVRRAGDGEAAGVFLCHGSAVPADRLLDVYTNRPFAKVFAASDRVGDQLRSLWAGIADPFPVQPVRGGPNISLAKIRRIQRMKAQGYKVKYIAEKVGVSTETVRRWAGRSAELEGGPATTK